ILVIDDSPFLRDLLAAALGRMGYQVSGASGGTEALALVEKESYDLLLVDLRMPGMDGQEFFRILASRHPELRLRVIFITGDTVSQNSREFLESTGQPFLAKPFDLSELRQMLVRELEKRQAG
ncbi:MAG: response regulator, partial [Dehalococcoidia bacterium]